MANLPTIHLNGTSKADLLKGYSDALRAVQDATKALRSVEFNQRDYYVKDGKVWSDALNEREDQFTKLYEIRKQLEATLHHILSQGR